jgi:subtilisin family serine protease
MRIWITPEEAAAAISQGRGKGVRIAVLDSGVEVSHAELRGMRLADDVAIVEDGMKLKAVPGEGCDLFGHGTAVAGIIHAMAPEAEIGSIRVLGEALSARTAIILEGARFAIENGYHILNCSLGCGVPEHVLKYKSWVDEAYLRGVHVVAACNNQDANRAEWPGFFTSVLTVNMAAAERDDTLFYRPGQLVEFAARGVDVSVLWRDGERKKMTGSSFAAPRVAAMLACLLSVYPGIPPLQAKALFHRLAQPWTRSLMAPNEGAPRREGG